MFVRRFSFFKVCQKLLIPDGGAGATGGAGGEGAGTTGSGEGNTGNGSGEGSEGSEGTEGDGTGSEGTKGDKTFTQADIDRVVKDRLAKERKKFEGVDVAEYKRLKEEADAKAEAEKTELDKANEKVTKAESEKQKAIEVANTRLILADFKVLAKDAGIKYIDDAYRLADLSTVDVKEDGSVDGLSAIIDSLVKDKPFLLGTEENKGGTGKIDNASKKDKGTTGTSFGQRLGEMAKAENKPNSERHYFK